MQVTPAPPQDIRRIDLSLPPSIGLHAVRLLEQIAAAGSGSFIYVAEGERRAGQLALALKSLAPDLELHLLPPWDCLPYDRVSPSREAMGQRLSVLRHMLRTENGPRLLVTSAAAILQRVPPRDIVEASAYRLRTGEAFSPESVQLFLSRTGYILDERVDEPGEAAIRGQVVDLYPASGATPCRIEHDGQTILAIRTYDPVSQRTESDVDSLLLEPASEVIVPDSGDPDASFDRFDGMEHRLPDYYSRLDTVFDYWPDAAMVVEAGAEGRRQLIMEQVGEAYEARRSARPDGAAPGSGVAPERLFVQDSEWTGLLSQRRLVLIHRAEQADAARMTVPRFAATANPTRALTEFLRAQQEAGRKIVLSAATRSDLSRLRRRVQRLQASVAAVERWSDIVHGRDNGWFALVSNLKDGFVDERGEIAVITAASVLGSRAETGLEQENGSGTSPLHDIAFQIGDAVIHTEHGIGSLDGIETITAGEAGTGDAIRLGYAGNTTLMVPAMEMDRVWRYGPMSSSISLDRLKSDAWMARREKIEAEIRDTAERLKHLVDARRSKRLQPLVPPSGEYERFVARFPYSETPDQQRAIEDVLDDLASGHPMDRLVCGDVGFGKTEVALRAAAAAALAGKQVAVIAPTTVLVRQHVRSFQRRFAGLGIEVAHLSRLVSPAEARAVKKGLKDGSIRIVIGTHALAAKGVAFKDLGLVIIDEEQKFGAAHKAKLQNMASEGHVLTLTATPIPRTLQAALVGLQDLSVIATPPARRQPIRTFLMPFDPISVREAFMRERRRRGQSFVVCSRVEDIEPMRARLAQLVPELDILIAHGQMLPAEADEAMVRFADGEGDVLLATNIIESGLDVPRANTMLVWRADRFGLSQLHQLRGRVGRGRIRGTAYLLTEPGEALPQATEKRLRTLEALDRLGAGFAISARDLDQRGAGTLLGEEQSGHVKLIGADLYQHMLKRALRGEAEHDWTPEINIGLVGRIPDEYVSEPEIRINLYARLARIDSSETADDLESEIEDRLGPMPDEVQNLVRLAGLKHQCLRLRIARIDAGPQAIALSFRPGAAEKLPIQAMIEEAQGNLRWSGERLIHDASDDDPDERYRLLLGLLDRLEP